MTWRDDMDRTAWETMDKTAGRTTPPPGLAGSGRPANYASLPNSLSARTTSLHGRNSFTSSFRYKQPGFFAVPPPLSSGPPRRALLARVAEYLSDRYSLPVPDWVHVAAFTLPELLDREEDICPGMAEFRQFRIDHSPQAFLKRNVVFPDRNLITP